MSTATSTPWALKIEPLPSKDPNLPARILCPLWAMLAFSAFFLALRLYCRAFRVRRLWWDDHLLVIGWGFLLSSTALQTANFNNGYLVAVLSSPTMSAVNLASESTVKLALGFCKTSIACTLYRFSGRRLRWVVVACAVVVNLFCLVQSLGIWGSLCGANRFHHVYPCGVLTDGIWMWRIGSLVSALTDLILSLVPIIIIWKIDMPRREKVGVCVATSLGVFAGVVAIITAGRTDRVRFTHGTTFSYDLAKVTIWVAAETNAAIVASSIPVLRVLLRDFGNRYGSGNSPESSGQPMLSEKSSGDGGGLSTMASGRVSENNSNTNNSEASVVPRYRPCPETKPLPPIMVDQDLHDDYAALEKEGGVVTVSRPLKAVQPDA